MNAGVKKSTLPCAYDLKKAKKAAQGRGFESKEAVACMHEGRVEVVPDGRNQFWTDRRPKHRKVYNQWVREIEFAKLLTIELSSFEELGGGQESRPEFVRCIACFDGWSWFAWEELEVSRFLLNPPGLQKDEPQWGIIPLEYTIFDPDTDAVVWARKHRDSALTRSAAFVSLALFETAGLYCQAAELLPDYEEVFRDEEGYRESMCEFPKCGCDVQDALYCVRPLPFELWKTAKLLRDNRQQLAALIGCMVYRFVADKNDDTLRGVDVATALRQAFLMGRRLVECGALLNSITARSWLAQHGRGKGFSRLGVLCASGEFRGKTAGEILQALEGRPDPDHPRHRLGFDDEGNLVRGNGKTLKPKSFATRLSQWRKKLA
tara:strand:+ start:1041 stop:2171 length:1131 start_codon:yes stop_codon:yes gene_type:complete